MDRGRGGWEGGEGEGKGRMEEELGVRRGRGWRGEGKEGRREGGEYGGRPL